MPITYPPKIDFFACLMFLGIIQALFLAYFFLFGKHGNRLANRFLGLLLLCFVFAITEILLCYTNYMFKVIWLIDFAEPTNFLIAPLLFLYIQKSVNPHFRKVEYLHFLPFLIWTLYLTITFFPLNNLAKYNAYINSYYPELPEVYDGIDYNYPQIYWIRQYVNHLMLMSWLIYIGVNIWILSKQFKNQSISFFSSKNHNLAWARRVIFWFLSIIISFIILKKLFPRDLGDHLIAAHLTLIIYIISINIIRKSTFFHPENKSVKKYEKSSLTSEIQENTLPKLQVLMESEKPFLDSSFSLPILAKSLAVSPHHLSQILNESLGQSFFDMVAQYRIKEAQKLLLENPNYKIEEIAEQVGYNSKSAFNTAFKKIVGVAPSAYRKA
jgi:AraC-like DNA-binding protein